MKIGCPASLLTNYKSTLSNVGEERKFIEDWLYRNDVNWLETYTE